MPRVIRVTINKTQGDLGLASPLPLGCDGPKQSSLKALGISPTTSFPGGIRPGPELTWYGLQSAELSSLTKAIFVTQSVSAIMIYI